MAANVSIIIPSNPADLKAIKSNIQEAADCKLRIDSENEQIKAIIDLVAEKYELPKNAIRKMIAIKHAATFDKWAQENEDLASLYEAVCK